MYDDKQDMSGGDFGDCFVVSKDTDIEDPPSHVYKCLDNNNRSTSSDNPAKSVYATTTDGVISTSDGYVWKYMYTIPNGTNTGSLDWKPNDVIVTPISSWVEMDTVNLSLIHI